MGTVTAAASRALSTVDSACADSGSTARSTRPLCESSHDPSVNGALPALGAAEQLYRQALLRFNQQEKSPGLFYFHPWEIDPDQPRPAGAGFRSRFRHYINLERMESRVSRLLGDFHWDRMDRVFLSE